MKTEELKKQLKHMMIVATEEPDEHRLRFLLTGLSKEALTEVSDLVKRSFEFADRERCRYFTMIRGAKHYHNCLVVSRVLEELPAYVLLFPVPLFLELLYSEQQSMVL